MEAGPICKKVLHDLFAILPLAPACQNDDYVRVRGPSGLVQWEAALSGGGVVVDIPTEWGRQVAATLPTMTALEGRYATMLACGRAQDEETRALEVRALLVGGTGGRGFTHKVVNLFNDFGRAAPEVSAGMGTIRGGAVKDADANPRSWTLSNSSRGNDVEIYVTQDAQEDGVRGVGFTTLGKVAYFFEHRGNDSRREDPSGRPERGVYTVSVAVQEYVTAGKSHSRKVDTATGCDVFTLWKAYSFYPVSAILRVVHIVHACLTTGGFTCGLVREVGKKAVWRCDLRDGMQYMLNKYFHSLGRASIA